MGEQGKMVRGLETIKKTINVCVGGGIVTVTFTTRCNDNH